MAAADCGYITSGDAKIYYRRTGSGLPIILLHGNGERHEIFRKQAECLRKDYEVILIDSRGHGRSHAGTQDYSVRLLAEDVHCVMKELGLERAVLFGFSDGANIALQVASLYPKEILAVIAVSGNVQPKGLVFWFRLAVRIRYLWYGLLHRLRIPVWHKKQLYGLMALHPQMTAEELGQITAPVLILTGRRDIIKPTHSMEMGRLIPHATVKIFRDSGHFTMFRKTEEYMRLVQTYLRRVGL